MVDNAMMSFGEDIIWWSGLYNIVLWISHCQAFTCKCMHSYSCWVYGEEHNRRGIC